MASSTIEREAYAVLVALKKYRSWIFCTKIAVYSDQYLIKSALKSAKLMRWSLALGSFPSRFNTKVGRSTQQPIVFLDYN